MTTDSDISTRLRDIADNIHLRGSDDGTAACMREAAARIEQQKIDIVRLTVDSVYPRPETTPPPADRIADVYYPLVLAFNATHVQHAGLARRERIGQDMLALPVEEYQRLFDMEQEVCRHLPAAALEEKLRRAEAAIERLTIDRDHYRSEATGATAQRIAELETTIAQEQVSNAQDRFELTEEIKRLTALSQSLRAAGEHSEVKFMAALERARALEALFAEIEATDPDDTQMSKVQFRGRVRELARQRHAIPEGIDQREADIALSAEVEAQALTQLVVEAGALMFCGERDPVVIAGKALLGLFRSLDREDLLDDIDEALPGYICDIAARIEPDGEYGEDDGE